MIDSKITPDVMVRYSVIVTDHNAKLVGHFQNLVGQCPVTNCYFQHCFVSSLTFVNDLTQASQSWTPVKTEF